MAWPELSDVNWLAGVAAGVAGFVIGGVWYGALFGKAWAKAYRFTQEEIEAMGKQPAKTFSLMFLCEVAAGVTLAVLAAWIGLAGAGPGALLGFMAWFGFAGAFGLTTTLGANRALAGFGIDAAQMLVTLVVMGVIVGVWR